MPGKPPFPLGWSKIPLSPLNLTLANTLPVGQSFLWRRVTLPPAEQHAGCTEEYSRVIESASRVVFLRQTAEHLYYTSIGKHGSPDDPRVTDKWINDYFQFDTQPSSDKLYCDWRLRDPDLFGTTSIRNNAIGVRVLRQDPWECLLAFITSTNNHIPRITSLLQRFCVHYSAPLIGDESDDESLRYYPFPPAHVLPTDLESTLRQLGFGYRAGFIESTLASLRQRFGNSPGAIEDGLRALREASEEDARDMLVTLKGVGRKVADCVMLMSMDKPSVIPIDTHVSAIAARHPKFPSRLRYKPMSPPVYNEVQAFLKERWGPLGGWCQAVMFAADLPTKQAVKQEVLTDPEIGVMGTSPLKRKTDEGLQLLVKATNTRRRSGRSRRD